MGDRQIVSNRHIIPYHNCVTSCINSDEGAGNTNCSEKDATTLKWCEGLCKQYEKQCQRHYSLTESETRAEIIFLHRLLRHARTQQERLVERQQERRQEQLTLEEDEEKEKGPSISAENPLGNENNDDELEIPYTQDWGGDNDFDGLYPTSSSVAKEPLRPGDVISYRSHLFVAGDKRGERVAIVIEVRPKEDPILRLDNNEVLLATTQVKRIRVMKGRKLEEHPQGLYREIKEFKLKKAGPLPGYEKSTEAQRIGSIMHRFNEQYMEIANDQGMPMDLMNRYKGVEVLKDDEDYDARSKIDSKSESKKGRKSSTSYNTCSREKEMPIGRELSTSQSTGGKRQCTNKKNENAASSCSIGEPSANTRSKKNSTVFGDDDYIDSPPVDSSCDSKSKDPVTKRGRSPPATMVSSSQATTSTDSDFDVPRKQKNAKKSSKRRKSLSSAVTSPSSRTRDRRKSASDSLKIKASISETELKIRLGITRRK